MSGKFVPIPRNTSLNMRLYCHCGQQLVPKEGWKGEFCSNCQWHFACPTHSSDVVCMRFIEQGKEN